MKPLTRREFIGLAAVVVLQGGVIYELTRPRNDELAGQVLVHLNATTVTYQQWKHNPASDPEWTKAMALLDKIQ